MLAFATCRREVTSAFRNLGMIHLADGVGDADHHTNCDAGARVAKAQRQRSAGSSTREHP